LPGFRATNAYISLPLNNLYFPIFQTLDNLVLITGFAELEIGDELTTFRSFLQPQDIVVGQTTTN
jgi:hypothetical protein